MSTLRVTFLPEYTSWSRSQLPYASELKKEERRPRFEPRPFHDLTDALDRTTTLAPLSPTLFNWILTQWQAKNVALFYIKIFTWGWKVRWDLICPFYNRQDIVGIFHRPLLTSGQNFLQFWFEKVWERLNLKVGVEPTWMLRSTENKFSNTIMIWKEK